MTPDYYQKCTRVYSVGKLSPLYKVLCDNDILPKEAQKEEEVESIFMQPILEAKQEEKAEVTNTEIESN